MLSAGCVALLTAGMSLCYSGDKITCSDQPIAGIETCRLAQQRLELQMQLAKKMGICSQDGSSCSGPLPEVGIATGLPQMLLQQAK